MSREVGRCRNVVNYMLTHATQDQRIFLYTKAPSADKVGSGWATWNNHLQDMSRSIAAITMKALEDEETKAYGGKKAKSKAGAKITATLSAVDGRLTKLKAAKEEANAKSTTATYFTKMSTTASSCSLSSSSSSSSSSRNQSCSAQEASVTPVGATPKRKRIQIDTA